MASAFEQLLAELHAADERDAPAPARNVAADYAAAVRGMRRDGKAFAKSMAPLLADLERTRRANVRMTKQVKADTQAALEAQEAARPVLGALLIKAVNDAVVSGRLSGSSAQAGLKALGLDGADAKMQAKMRQVADAAHKLPAPDDHKAMVASLASMPEERQRAAVDHLVRTGKMSGGEAMKVLDELKRHRAG